MILTVGQFSAFDLGIVVVAMVIAAGVVRWALRQLFGR